MMPDPDDIRLALELKKSRMAIEEISAAPSPVIAHRIKQTDNRFLLSTGVVDLLLMCNTLPEPEFRLYIQLSREWRRRAPTI
jgi:hypothetical protein